MRAFLTKPTPQDKGIVQCHIKRNKSGRNKTFPEYVLSLRDQDRFLMCSKKRRHQKTANYLISMQRGDMDKSSENTLGKLRANFLGTEFTVYDNGVNYKDAFAEQDQDIRQELGLVLYAKNVLGSKAPRKMKVCVPTVDRSGNQQTVWKPTRKHEEMSAKCKDSDYTNMVVLNNKKPEWNDQVGAHVLDFGGRVTMASVKNFQLVTPEDQDNIILQFGRVGKDEFTMDFQWPLSALQAFAITLSSFDSKLACDS
jgi:tubby-related protein 1